MYPKFSSTNRLNLLGDEGVSEVCIANVSPKERKKRLNFAIRFFLFTSALLIILLVLEVNPAWRLILFLPLVASASSFFQWRDKT
jgi:predicted nucleic acid-binding Zn ribbon protein